MVIFQATFRMREVRYGLTSTYQYVLKERYMYHGQPWKSPFIAPLSFLHRCPCSLPHCMHSFFTPHLHLPFFVFVFLLPKGVDAIAVAPSVDVRVCTFPCSNLPPWRKSLTIYPLPSSSCISFPSIILFSDSMASFSSTLLPLMAWRSVILNIYST